MNAQADVGLKRRVVFVIILIVTTVIARFLLRRMRNIVPRSHTSACFSTTPPPAVECKLLHFTCRTTAEADEFRHSFRDCIPGCRLIHYDDDDIRRVVSKSGPHVLAAYDCVKPFAFKADIFRLCVLIDQGGLYLDANMRARTGRLDRYVNFDAEHVFVRENKNMKARLPYLNSIQFCDIALWQAFIYTKHAGSAVLQYVLNGIVDRVLHLDKRVIASFLHPDDAILYFTGPTAFGEFAAQALGVSNWRQMETTPQLQLLDFDGNDVHTQGGAQIVGKDKSNRMRHSTHYHAMYKNGGVVGVLCDSSSNDSP